MCVDQVNDGEKQRRKATVPQSSLSIIDFCKEKVSYTYGRARLRTGELIVTCLDQFSVLKRIGDHVLQPWDTMSLIKADLGSVCVTRAACLG